MMMVLGTIVCCQYFYHFTPTLGNYYFQRNPSDNEPQTEGVVRADSRGHWRDQGDRGDDGGAGEEGHHGDAGTGPQRAGLLPAGRRHGGDHGEHHQHAGGGEGPAGAGPRLESKRGHPG